MKVFTGCLTNKGNYRSKNQDSVVCHKKTGNTLLLAACVCDGIGSFSQSEIASKMVTDGISRWFAGIKDFFPNAVDEETLVEDLDMSIRELNELVYDYGKKKGIDIGCTMSMLLLAGHSYYVFHVGDSRIYRVVDAFYPITCDEVDMVESCGQVKRLLSNFIGKSSKIWINRSSGRIENHEFFLMGTDGLFKRLVYQDISGFVEKVKSDQHAQEICKLLLELVMARGERDNVSSILIYVERAR